MNGPKPSVQADPHSEPSDSTPLTFNEGLLLADLSEAEEEEVSTSSDVGAFSGSSRPGPHSEASDSTPLAVKEVLRLEDVSTSSDLGAVSGSSRFHSKFASSISFGGLALGGFERRSRRRGSLQVLRFRRSLRILEVPRKVCIEPQKLPAHPVEV